MHQPRGQKVKVTQLQKPCGHTTVNDHCRVLRTPVLPAAVAGAGLHVDTTAYVF